MRTHFSVISRAICTFALLTISIVAAFAAELVQSVTIPAPGYFVGGYSTTATVTLTKAAPAAGTQVFLSFSGDLIVPSSIKVAAFAKTATFKISANPVGNNEDCFVYASSLGAPGKNDPLVSVGLHAPSIIKLAIVPGTIVGGATGTGYVTLDAPPAPSSAIILRVDSNDVDVPFILRFPAGSKTATFTVRTSGVFRKQFPTVTGFGPSSFRSCSLVLLPPSLTSLNLPASVKGGTDLKVGVTLNTVSPSFGVQVTVTGGPLVDGGTFFVPEGSTSATGTFHVSSVSADTSAEIHASANGQELTKSIVITAPAVKSVTLSSYSVANTTTVTGTVNLSSPASTGGCAVALASNNASADPGTSVTVAEGATSATFSITTTAVPTQVVAAISATANSVTKTTNLTIKPSALLKFDVSNAPFGGLAAHAIVVLNGPAPSGGAVISLASSDTSIISPTATVTVPEGLSQASFDIPTSPVVAEATPTVTASYGGVSKPKVVVVRKARPLSVTLENTTIIGSTSTIAVVTLTSPAPVGGLTVDLGSDTPSVANPADTTVFINEGETTNTFTVNSTTPLVDTNVVIFAGVGNYHAGSTLTVKEFGCISATIVDSRLGFSTVNVTFNRDPNGASVTIALASGNQDVLRNQVITETLSGGTDFSVPFGSLFFFEGEYVVPYTLTVNGQVFTGYARVSGI